MRIVPRIVNRKIRGGPCRLRCARGRSRKWVGFASPALALGGRGLHVQRAHRRGLGFGLNAGHVGLGLPDRRHLDVDLRCDRERQLPLAHLGELQHDARRLQERRLRPLGPLLHPVQV